MDLSNKQINIKGLLTSGMPVDETIVTVAVYETVIEGIRKLIGEYDISLLGVFITDSADPQLLQLVIDKLLLI
jgi:hypothetical protein